MLMGASFWLIAELANFPAFELSELFSNLDFILMLETIGDFYYAD